MMNYYKPIGITHDGIIRIFKVFFITIVMLICTFSFIAIVSAEEQKIGLTYLNSSQVIISNDMGADVQLARNTTNQNQMDIKTIIFTSNYNFKKNVLYEYEIETNNSYITNNTNKIALKGYNMSCNLISIQGYNTNYLRVRFTCPNDTSYILLSLSNLSGQNITTGYQIGWNSIYLWQITDTIDVSPIINNDNQNTQNIINNNTQNTQDIINNNNQNAQDIIDSTKVCSNVEYKYNQSNKSELTSGFLDSSGVVQNSSTTYYTDYIEFSKGGNLNISTTSWTLGNTSSYCLYDKNKTLKNCYMYSNATTVNQSLTYDGYVRASVYLADNNWTITISGYRCQNGNQVVSDSINNLDNTINDSSIGSSASDASSFLNNFTTDTFGLTAIITAPLSLIQSITSSSCSTLNLPLPYLNNKYLTLPCMSSIYQQYFGSLFTLYQTITFGVIAYWVCIRIFNLVKDFKNPEHDEIEVMDL